VKVIVTVIPESLDHPGGTLPSHYEECDACRQRLHDAIEEAIIGYVNRPEALPGIETVAFVGVINKYELVGNNIRLRKRTSPLWKDTHSKDELLPKDWIESDER
jgi:hypothetical protein